MADLSRDAVLAETRRALESNNTREGAKLFTELEAWIPVEGSMIAARKTRPLPVLLRLAWAALTHEFPEKATELAQLLEAYAEPWRTLAETVEWCRNRPVSELRRTLRENPDGLDGFVRTASSRKTYLRDLTLERRRVLRRYPCPVLTGGRFLSWDPNQRAPNAEHPSNGYFDQHGAPPWDTFLAIDANARVIAWVPRQHVVDAERGAGTRGGALTWITAKTPDDMPSWLRTAARESARSG